LRVEIHELGCLLIAPKYRTMAASGEGGKGELVFGKGDKGKSKGLRQANSLTVETYSMEEASPLPVGGSSSMSTLNTVGSSREG